MELRTEAAQVLTAAAALAFTLNVTYQRVGKDRPGTLEITNAGVSFLEKENKNARLAFSWGWEEVQRFELSENHIRVLSYEDRVLLLGSDQPFDFVLPDQSSWRGLYDSLKDRLDARLIARVAAEVPDIVWELPAKSRKGDQGRLYFGTEIVVFKTRALGRSRTWRLRDIENVSNSGPFSLSIESIEQTHDFQLKRPLPDSVYQALWLRLNPRRLTDRGGLTSALSASSNR